MATDLKKFLVVLQPLYVDVHNMVMKDTVEPGLIKTN